MIFFAEIRPAAAVGKVVLVSLGLLATGGPRKIQIEHVRNLSYERSDKRILLKRISGTSPLFFQTKISCDVDGSPNAYHPLNDDLSLDVIESAGGRRAKDLPNGALEVQPSPDVVVYVDGKPYIQPDGEFKGFYLSETSYENSALQATDPARYLDARKTQYIVLPDGFVPEAKLGDLAIVYDPATKAHAAAIFGDVGPSTESGEASLATLQRLGMATSDGKSSPGQARDDLFFLVFPGTAAKLEAAEPWPHLQTTIDKLAESEFANWGGEMQIEAVLRMEPQGGSLPDDAENGWIYDELATYRVLGLTNRYEFGLPARCNIDGPGRLPCAPEVIGACGAALDAIQAKIGDAELKRAPSQGISNLIPRLHSMAEIFRRFPMETGDELEPPIRAVARVGALEDRARRLR